MRPALLALLFCVLLLRTFVPAGFMIAPVHAGTLALVPCPDARARPAHGRHHGEEPEKHREAPCPYAALAAPPLPSAPPILAAQAPAEPSFATAAPASPRVAAAALLPPSTGPPVSARS